MSSVYVCVCVCVCVCMCVCVCYLFRYVVASHGRCTFNVFCRANRQKQPRFSRSLARLAVLLWSSLLSLLERLGHQQVKPLTALNPCVAVVTK